MATGSVLPWARVSAFFGTVDVAGTDGDGVVTVLCAVVIAVLSLVAFTGSGGRGFVAGALGAATVALVVALVDVADVARLVGSAEDVGFAGVEVSIGVGLWLVLASSVATVVGCALALRPVRPSA